MQINEVSKQTKLTKKAIDYYEQQGLISPAVLGNGYREYSREDREILKKVGILRKLNVSTREIRAILNDTTNATLHAISVRKELDFQQDRAKKEILQRLSLGMSYDEVSGEIQALEQLKPIVEKLLDAFPGYYGRFVCLHFSRFLNEPIRTQEQQSAYEAIISFLDSVPQLDIPKDLEVYLIDGTKHIGTCEMMEMLENIKKSLECPEKFLSDNKEVIEMYLSYKRSEEYEHSPAGRLTDLMRRFNSTSGYNHVFLPAMKRLSDSYREYCNRMETANEKLLERYPEFEELNKAE